MCPLFLDAVSNSFHSWGQPTLTHVQLQTLRINFHFAFTPFHILILFPLGHTKVLWVVLSSSLSCRLQSKSNFHCQLAQLQAPTLRSQNLDNPAPWSLRSKSNKKHTYTSTYHTLLSLQPSGMATYLPFSFVLTYYCWL